MALLRELGRNPSFSSSTQKIKIAVQEPGAMARGISNRETTPIAFQHARDVRRRSLVGVSR
jgi:hypothetical protein